MVTKCHRSMHLSPLWADYYLLSAHCVWFWPLTPEQLAKLVVTKCHESLQVSSRGVSSIITCVIWGPQLPKYVWYVVTHIGDCQHHGDTYHISVSIVNCTYLHTLVTTAVSQQLYHYHNVWPQNVMDRCSWVVGGVFSWSSAEWPVVLDLWTHKTCT